MDKNLALKLANQLIPDEKLPLNLLRISLEAKKEIDSNKDNNVSKSELIKGFENDQVSFSENSKSVEIFKGGKIPQANKISFLAGREEKAGPRPEDLRGEMTYKAEQWFKATDNPNVGDPNNNFKGISGWSKSNLSYNQVNNLVGKDFQTAANTLKTPYDIATLTGSVIQYDYDRADKNLGPGGTYSGQEVLSMGKGICRDTHILAVDLLRANGYNAKQLGYSSADSVFHAFAVYQDPKTGKWGALEYGKVYPPEMLNADSPEEAFLKVRPDALVISEYTVPSNPNERSYENKVYYTPTVREYNSFVFGKHSGNLDVTTTNNAVQLSGKVKDWEYAVKYNQANPMTPLLDNAVMGGVWYNVDKIGIKIGVGGGYMPNVFNNTVGPNDKVSLPTGFVYGTIEGNHPNLVKVEDIAKSGVNISLNSKFTGVGTLAFNKSGDITDSKGFQENKRNAVDLGVSNGLSRFNWNPDITINREFDVWGDKSKDLNVFAKYGTDFDSNVFVDYYRGGAAGLPVTQFVQTGAEAKIDNEGKYKVGAAVYVPIGHVYSNDFSPEPLVNVKVSTPYVSVSTTQGQNTHIYNVDAGLDITKGKVDTRIEAFAGLEDDRINKTYTPRAGGRISLKF
jgi:hypothetical protein